MEPAAVCVVERGADQELGVDRHGVAVADEDPRRHGGERVPGGEEADRLVQRTGDEPAVDDPGAALMVLAEGEVRLVLGQALRRRERQVQAGGVVAAPPARRIMVRWNLMPDVLERPEAELLDEVEPRLVAAAQNLRLMLGEKRVVGVRRLPAVDHEVPVGLVDVVQELRADVPVARAEEARPLALRPVDLLERDGIAHLVAEDERDHRRPPRSWCALKKFSLPAVAIAADALISSESAAAATICAKR